MRPGFPEGLHIDARSDPLLMDRLVTGYGLMSPDSAADEFFAVQKRWSRRAYRVAGYQVIQSFGAWEPVTPDLVHDIGCELARRIFDGHQVLIATHLNRPHLHSHIIANRPRLKDGRSLQYPKHITYAMALANWAHQVTNEITARHGLETVTANKDLPGSWQERRFRSPVRQDINLDIRAAAALSENLDELKENLREIGYDVMTDENGETRIKTPQGRNYWMLRSFYLPWEIEVMTENGGMRAVRREERRKQEAYLRPVSPDDTIGGKLTPAEAQLLFWIQMLRRADRFSCPDIPYAAQRNLVVATRAFRIIHKAGAKMEEDVSALLAQKEAERKEMTAELMALRDKAKGPAGQSAPERERQKLLEEKRSDLSRQINAIRKGQEGAARARQIADQYKDKSVEVSFHER